MDKNNQAFKQFEKLVTLILFVSVVLFVVFLIAAGNGIIWLKVITAILSIALCGFCLFLLFQAKLLLRPRSLWMTVAAACLIICFLFSLILNYPAPL